MRGQGTLHSESHLDIFFLCSNCHIIFLLISVDNCGVDPGVGEISRSWRVGFMKWRSPCPIDRGDMKGRSPCPGELGL